MAFEELAVETSSLRICVGFLFPILVFLLKRSNNSLNGTGFGTFVFLSVGALSFGFGERFSPDFRSDGGYDPGA